eukprot:8139047-Lingulodinium_polyedra.AAC.1
MLIAGAKELPVGSSSNRQQSGESHGGRRGAPRRQPGHSPPPRAQGHGPSQGHASATKATT